MSNDGKKKTLVEGDIVTAQRVGRRGALGVIGATVIGAAATAVGLTTPSTAKARTDTDSGPNADRANQGQGARTGITDSDTGPNQDGPDHGQGRRSDTDRGPNQDPAGGARPRTDSDRGPNQDPANGGRGRTDTDSGPNADRAREGRGG